MANLVLLKHTSHICPLTGKILCVVVYWFKIFLISLYKYSSKFQSLSNFGKVDVDGSGLVIEKILQFEIYNISKNIFLCRNPSNYIFQYGILSRSEFFPQSD